LTSKAPPHHGQLATQRAAYELIDDCLQIHGGGRYRRDYKIEGMLRDARLGPIGGGTDENMCEILGKSLSG
jgi:acyl-CoA dehydrogenase